jgi:hypothetical protein
MHISILFHCFFEITIGLKNAFPTVSMYVCIYIHMLIVCLKVQ